MSEIKYTLLVADAERVRTPEGDLVATVWHQYPSKDRLPGESWMAMMDRTAVARERANTEAVERARLFAAAPELLEALESIRRYGLDTLSGRADGGADDREWQREAVNEMTKRARIAIEKATGAQS